MRSVSLHGTIHAERIDGRRPLKCHQKTVGRISEVSKLSKLISTIDEIGDRQSLFIPLQLRRLTLGQIDILVESFLCTHGLFQAGMQVGQLGRGCGVRSCTAKGIILSCRLISRLTKKRISNKWRKSAAYEEARG